MSAADEVEGLGGLEKGHRMGLVGKTGTIKPTM
jgi:hypothetical protein